MRESDFYVSSQREDYRDLHDNIGIYLTHEEWEEFKTQVDKFYSLHTPENIETHNYSIMKKRGLIYEPSPFKPCPPVFIPEHLDTSPKKKKWIYWLTSPARKGVKIGRTYKHLTFRLKQIARKLKAEVYCIDAFQTSHCGELELLTHAVFEESLIEGEWFDLQPEQIQSIPDVIKTLHLQRGLEWAK